MTHALTLTQGDDADLALSQIKVELYHYLHAPVDPRARPMVYIVRHDGNALGLVMLGIPHAVRCRGWCWKLPEPAWTRQELDGIRSRTLRML